MELIKTEKYVSGLKQTKKKIESGQAKIVYLASDANSYYTAPIEELCKEKGVEIKYIDTMKNLAKMAGVEVKTAAVTIVKDA